jgi:ribosomal protein S1
MSSMDDKTWENIKAKYKPGTFVQGKVTKHMHFGVFVDIREPGVKGLIRIVDFVDEGDMSEDLYPEIGATVGGIVYEYSRKEDGQINLNSTPSVLHRFLVPLKGRSQQI